MSGETSGVRGDNRGREASGVAHESPRVGDDEEGHEASRVAEKPWGSRHGLSGGFKSPQDANTPGVTKLTRGDKIPGGTTVSEGSLREDGRRLGGEEPPPPPEQSGRRKPTMATKRQWVG